MLVYKSGWERLLYKVIFKHSSQWREDQSLEFVREKYSSLRESQNIILAQEEDQEKEAEMIQRRMGEKHREGEADIREAAVGWVM